MEDKQTQSNRAFPEGFLWGATTASYQVEGGIENTDWAEAAREGKVPFCGRACDHYHKYEEDFDLAKSLGHNAHRISIEWARIEPEEGKFDEKEVEHYRAVLRALKVRGITPFVTLWHFTLPLWFSKSGGFERKDSAGVFSRYCEFVFSRLKGEANFWMTINEPEVWAGNGYLQAKWPPFRKSYFAHRSVMQNMAEGHMRAYCAIKALDSNAQVGIAKHNMFFDASGNLFAWPFARFLSVWWNHGFIRKTKGFHDFIGLNHYFHRTVGWQPKSALRSDMGWEIHPESLYRCLVELRRYQVPIYVTENGLADADDSRRALYIKGYLAKVHNAIKDGVDVRGYLHWSLMDNYEWAEGFTKRFGLIEINYETLARTVRPSARVYAEICKTNSLPSQ